MGNLLLLGSISKASWPSGVSSVVFILEIKTLERRMCLERRKALKRQCAIMVNYGELKEFILALYTWACVQSLFSIITIQLPCSLRSKNQTKQLVNSLRVYPIALYQGHGFSRLQ